MSAKSKTSKSKQKHVARTKTHILLRRSMVIYMAMVFVLFFFVSASIYTGITIYHGYQNSIRYDRISAIYNELNLGDDYSRVRSDIFGDKRIYSWDAGRSQSSSIEGGHNDTPANTVAALTAKITGAGFAPASSAYEGSASPQYYFKNDNDEYVRLQVMSAAYQNHLIYAIPFDAQLDQTQAATAPSYYILKVNLDDNNE